MPAKNNDIDIEDIETIEEDDGIEEVQQIDIDAPKHDAVNAPLKNVHISSIIQSLPEYDKSRDPFANNSQSNIIVAIRYVTMPK